MRAIDSTWGIEDSVAHRCIELIRRHAPLMMKVGDEMPHMPGDKRPVAPAERAEILQRRRAGETIATIAQALDRCHETVARVCREAGLGAMRVPHKKTRVRRHPVRLAEARALRAQGLKWREVSAKLGVSIKQIFEWQARERAALQKRAA